MKDYKLTAALDNCVNIKTRGLNGKYFSKEEIIDHCINVVAAKPDNLQRSQILKMYQMMKIAEQVSSKPVDHGSTSTTPIAPDGSDIKHIEKLPSEALKQQIDDFLLHPEKIDMYSNPELLVKTIKLETANEVLRKNNEELQKGNKELGKIPELLEKVTKLEADNEELQKNNKELGKISELLEKVTKLEAHNEELRKNNKELGKIPELLEKVTKLEADNKELQKDNEELNELSANSSALIDTQNDSLANCSTTLDKSMDVVMKLAASEKYTRLVHELLTKLPQTHPELMAKDEPYVKLLQECANITDKVEDITLDDSLVKIYSDCLHSQNTTWPADIEAIFDSYSSQQDALS